MNKYAQELLERLENQPRPMTFAQTEQLSLVKVALKKGWRPKFADDTVEAMCWLTDKGFLIATLPDGQVVVRKTENRYTHVIATHHIIRGESRWFVYQWTGSGKRDPQSIVNWLKNRVSISGGNYCDNAAACRIWRVSKPKQGQR